ncbi:MAG: hypothetical protein S4CHLAM123_03800 [Chlamydiales bacterium]|nr:hypothetical protein [Chlamydiales bacterium]
MKVHITQANVNDREGAKHLFRGKRAASIKKIWADMGYQGPKLRDVAKSYNKDLEVVKRPRSRVWVTQEQIALGLIPTMPAFTVLPKRWIVERTFAWIGRYRRMSKDYEFKIHTSKTMVFLCLARTFLKRYFKMT